MRLFNMSGWQRIGVVVFLSCISLVRSKDVKVFKQGVGQNAIEMVDETQFQNSPVISFDDEIMKKVDFSDEYDELVPKLPRYEVHQYGKNAGYTLVPIVTRSKPYWSTPMPRILLEKTWSTPDAIRNKVTKSGRIQLKVTTSSPRTKPDEELLPPENNEVTKKYHLSGGNRRPVSEFLSGNGRHVVTTTSNESPVEIIMAPQTPKPTVRPKPASDHSNQFRLLPGPHRHDSTSNGGAWSWRREWTIGPDGKRVEVFHSSGNVPQERLPSRHQPISSNSPAPTQSTKTAVTQSQQTQSHQPQTMTKFTTLSQRTGVTKCRVLDAVADGKAAPDNDLSCKLLYPGYPADDSCKCSFRANGRDEQGCAVGFLYACKPAAAFAQQ